MNVITLAGRVAREIELRFTTSSKQVVSFSMAVQRPYQKDKVDFIDCVALGKQAETIDKYVNKGDQIIVSGYLYIDSYAADDGSTKRYAKVDVEKFDFGSKKKQGNEDIEDNYPVVDDEDVPF